MLAIVTFLNFIENFITYFHLHFSHGVLVCWAVGWLMPWGGNDFKTYTLINNSSEELLLGAVGKAVSSGLLSLTQVQSVPKVVALEMQVFQLLPARHF